MQNIHTLILLTAARSHPLTQKGDGTWGAIDKEGIFPDEQVQQYLANGWLERDGKSVRTSAVGDQELRSMENATGNDFEFQPNTIAPAQEVKEMLREDEAYLNSLKLPTCH